MSYIPDCRNDEFYNEKYLSESNKRFVRGFDWCCEEVVDNFFDNFNTVDSDYLDAVLSRNLPEHLQTEYQMDITFPISNSEETTEDRKVSTYLDYLRYHLLCWIERHRDDLITSMIDNMSDSEYEKAKSDVDGVPFSYSDDSPEKKHSKEIGIDLSEIMRDSQAAIAGANRIAEN